MCVCLFSFVQLTFVAFQCTSAGAGGAAIRIIGHDTVEIDGTIHTNGGGGAGAHSSDYNCWYVCLCWMCACAVF